MRFKSVITALCVFLVLILAWEMLAKLNIYNILLLPPPSESIKALIDLWQDGTLASDLCDSMGRYLPGFILGSTIGIVIGIVSGISKKTGNIINPLFHFLRSIPPVALIPFILVIFGINDIGKISLVAWACMFPVWLNTQAGIMQIPKEYLWAARVFKINGIRSVVDIWIPSSLPNIVSGLRIAVATGLFALVASEMFAASSGIGFRIVYSHQLFQTDKMIGMILLIGIIAFLADLLLSTVRKSVARWEAI